MGKIAIFFVVFIILFAALVTLSGSRVGAAGTAVAGTSVTAARQSAAAQTAASPCGSSYTVKTGDNLSAIAAACGVTLAALESANPSVLAPNYIIYPNQVLVIPAGGIPNTGGSTYTVVAGDTLFSIARRYGTTVAAMQTANPSITDVNLIFPGQVLTLPAGIPNTGGNTYTVVSGDTLYSISRRYGTTVAALQSANPIITNVNLIYPGWVLTIP